MKYESIDDIYSANNKVRERLKEIISALTEQQTSTLPEGEKWTVAQIIEHIAMVDETAMRICAKLLLKAQDAGQVFDGKVVISDNFVTKGAEVTHVKLDAPDIVQPRSGRTISESLAKLDQNAAHLEKLKAMFESVDGTSLKFPHPFFGDISAQEWLALKGGHERRHIQQIENVLAKIN